MSTKSVPGVKYRVRIVRPATTGEIHSKEFDTYAECEDYVERRVERMVDRGWDASDLPGSTASRGTVELTHDDEADRLLIKWNLVVTCWTCAKEIPWDGKAPRGGVDCDECLESKCEYESEEA